MKNKNKNVEGTKLKHSMKSKNHFLHSYSRNKFSTEVIFAFIVAAALARNEYNKVGNVKRIYRACVSVYAMHFVTKCTQHLSVMTLSH